MKKWPVGVGLLGIALTGVSVPTSHAVTIPRATAVEASNVVVDASGYTAHEISVTIYDPENLVANDPSREFTVTSTAAPSASAGADTSVRYAGNGERTSDGETYDVYRFPLPDRYDASSARGWRDVSVNLAVQSGPATGYVQSNAFAVHSNTAFSEFNATEPVHRGRKTKVTGRLTKLEYPVQSDGYQYRGYANKTVAVQFKKAGTTTWVDKGSATTNSNGDFTSYLQVDAPGTWRATFAGNSWARPRSSGGDYVDILPAVPQVTAVKASDAVVYAKGYTTHDIYVTVYDPDDVVSTDLHWFDVRADRDKGAIGDTSPVWYVGDVVKTADGTTYDTYRFRVDGYRADMVRGWRHITVDLYAGETPSEPYTERYAFAVKSNAYFSSFNATEPVAQGGKTKVTGRLVKLEYPWQSDGYQYRGYGDKTVTIQFQKAGTTTWVDKGTATTNSTGEFTSYLTADENGTWRVRFAGNNWARSRHSSGDFVDVL